MENIWVSNLELI